MNTLKDQFGKNIIILKVGKHSQSVVLALEVEKEKQYD